MGPLRGPGSEGSEGSAYLWQADSKGGGIAFGDEFKVSVTGFPAGHSHSEPLAKNLGTCRI